MKVARGILIKRLQNGNGDSRPDAATEVPRGLGITIRTEVLRRVTLRQTIPSTVARLRVYLTYGVCNCRGYK
jgi:hypothetical protein